MPEESKEIREPEEIVVELTGCGANAANNLYNC